MVVGAQSISAVSTVSTVSSEHWVASPTLDTRQSVRPIFTFRSILQIIYLIFEIFLDI